MPSNLLQELAPKGVLRTGINMANFLLVTGKSANGDPDGVSPDMARAIAEKLGVACEFIPYVGPGELADAAASDAWDIGNIAAEPERAKTIDFSQAYCEIQATYLISANASIQTLADVDAAGNRIAVKNRAAYDLWLTENLQHASLVKAATIDESFEVFRDQELEVLAGLRPKLLEQQAQMPGSWVMDESFTAVQQSIGCRPGRPQAAAFLQQFVQDSINNGFVQSLISKHGVDGRLSVAALRADH